MQGTVECAAEAERILVNKLSRTTHKLKRLQARFDTRSTEIIAVSQLEDTGVHHGALANLEASHGETATDVVPCSQKFLMDVDHSRDISSPLGDTSGFFPPTPLDSLAKVPQQGHEDTPSTRRVDFSFTVNTTISPSNQEVSASNRAPKENPSQASSDFLSRISSDNFRGTVPARLSTNPPLSSSTTEGPKRMHDGDEEHESGSRLRRRVVKDGSQGLGPIIGGSQTSGGGPSPRKNVGRPRKSQSKPKGRTGRRQHSLCS